MINVGAFVSTAGGLAKIIDRARALLLDSVMIFASSPQSWKRRVFLDADVTKFRKDFELAGFQSLWIHGTYLMNFGSSNPTALRQSIDTLVLEIEDARRLGAQGVIFHLGSHTGRGFDVIFDQVVAGLAEAVERTPAGPPVGGHLTSDTFQVSRGEVSEAPWIVIENSAGMGGSIGSKFAELGRIVRRLPADRVKVCLDIQHIFAAGYPVHTKVGLAETLAEFDREIGLDRLVVLHANDSKVPLAGGRDRHENIGDGAIGDAGWRVMTHHPVLKKRPFLLEVPGFDGHGPDKPNVDRLRALAEGQ